LPVYRLWVVKSGAYAAGRQRGTQFLTPFMSNHVKVVDGFRSGTVFR
jgi:hypothetical protein